MGRTRRDWSSGSLEQYKLFRKAHPEIKLSSSQWRAIIYAFNESFRDHVLETGDVVKLPERTGLISIAKIKTRTTKINKEGKEVICLPIDWKKTKEKGKYIYNFNHHTEGFFFRWKWFKITSTIKHVDLWYFKPSRTTARLIPHYLRVDEKYQHLYKQF